MSSSNPYTPPFAPASLKAEYEPSSQMEYVQSVRFIFDSPNWFLNLLFVALCALIGAFIPIIPGLVVLGYQFELFEALCLRPQQVYPDFKLDQIATYLVRGLYPFLVALICSVVAVPAVLLVVGIPVGIMIGLISAVGEDGAPIVALIMVPLIICVLIVVGFLLNLVLVPMIMRAGLSQDIGSAFDFAFAKDFARKMWKEMLLAGLFQIALALAAQLVGLLLFCVGIFLTMACVQLAQAHLGVQLYRLYLLRGGQKIPLKSSMGIVI